MTFTPVTTIKIYATRGERGRLIPNSLFNQIWQWISLYGLFRQHIFSGRN
ncbi:MAG: hypothetical protein WCJ93_04080 [Methanomicrobiales archaeon]